MPKKSKPMLADELMLTKIYIIRGQKVMFDRDLAELYGVETKYLKRQIRRNAKRFPEDFMFELTKVEFENWRCQFVTSNSDRMGLRHTPFAFTEQGVAMLSGVLSSDRAIAVNIQLMRVFTKMRSMLLTHKDLLLKMQAIEKQIGGHDEKNNCFSATSMNL